MGRSRDSRPNVVASSAGPIVPATSVRPFRRDGRGGWVAARWCWRSWPGRFVVFDLNLPGVGSPVGRRRDSRPNVVASLTRPIVPATSVLSLPPED